MANKSGNAYALTTLCPIKNGTVDSKSFAALTRWFLQDLSRDEHSPMAKVPETYLSRFYVLNDVFYQGFPAKSEHLQSPYLVFSSNFHGALEPYLTAMWHSISNDIQNIWQHCVAFEQVIDASSFISYIKECQVNNDLFFVGANDLALDEQLKALYLKQEFSRFVYEHQHYNTVEQAGKLQQAFNNFIKRSQPGNVSNPTWLAGACLETVVE